LITLIQSSAQLNAAKLAKVCSTSERNIYRDLKELEGAGVPISFDNETGGYCLRRDFFLRPVDFTLEEAMALVLLGREIGQTERISHAAEAGKAIEKLLATFPSAIREMVDELLPRMSIDLARTANEPTADIYTRIRQAITNKRALQCKYESPSQNGKGDAGSFRFDPYGLYFGQRAWYAVGLHHGHSQVRTLKLARLVQCKSLDKPYFIPDDFTLKKYFGQAWRMMPSGKLYNIRLHFDAKMAETVADTHWHDSQEEMWNEDGSIEIHFRVDGLEEIIWWIMSYGPHCRVIEPAKLRTRIAELHTKAAALY
jgi:proteasome accessory factor B